MVRCTQPNPSPRKPLLNGGRCTVIPDGLVYFHVLQSLWNFSVGLLRTGMMGDTHAAHLFRVILAIEQIPFFASFEDFPFL